MAEKAAVERDKTGMAIQSAGQRLTEKPIEAAVMEKLREAGIAADAETVALVSKSYDGAVDVRQFQNLVIQDCWTEQWPEGEGKEKSVEVKAEIWTGAIQAALDRHKAVYIPYRDKPYYIDGPLIIKSGGRLFLDELTEMRLKPFTNTCMIRNEHVQDGHDAPASFEQPCDSDICIEGGIWTTLATGPQQSNGNTNGFSDKAGTLRSHGTIFFNHVRGVQVRQVTIRQCRPHGIQMTCCEQFLVEFILFEDHGRDGVHINGPARYGLIRHIRGKTYDDMVSLLPWDWANTGFSFGKMEFLLVEDVQPSAWAAMRLLPGTKTYPNGAKVPCDLEHCVVRNIKGMAHFKLYDQPNLEMGRDNDFADPIGTLGNVYFRDIEFTEPGIEVPFQIGVHADGLEIHDVRLAFKPEFPGGLPYELVNIGPQSMTIKMNPSDPATWVEVFSPDKDCVVKHFRLSDVRARYEAGGAVQEKSLDPAALVRVVVQKLNPNYPKTTPRGGTGRGILIPDDPNECR